MFPKVCHPRLACSMLCVNNITQPGGSSLSLRHTWFEICWVWDSFILRKWKNASIILKYIHGDCLHCKFKGTRNNSSDGRVYRFHRNAELFTN